MNNVWYQFRCINTYSTLWLEQGKLLSMCKNKRSHTHIYFETKTSLKWRHNGGDGVSNHQSNHCLLYRLFRRRSKKTSKLRVTSLCAGNLTVIGEFPAQKPITLKMFPFDDIIMLCYGISQLIWRTVSLVYLYYDMKKLSTLMVFFMKESTGNTELWPLLLTWFNFNPSMDK